MTLTTSNLSINNEANVDLSTTYLGFKLRTPLIPAASPLSHDIDNIKRMEDAGASAVVMHSLFEEQVRLEDYELHHHLTYGTHSFPEALTYFPEPEEFKVGPVEYLEHIAKAKSSVKIPIIASLNGCSPGGWTHYAKLMEEAGADAIELNIYNVPTNMDLTGEEIEESYIHIVRSVKYEVKIPVAVKLSPYFTNMANMAKKLDHAGANGLVLFNRFYQPDINLEELEIEPNVMLSTPQSLRLPMRWIAILYGNINADLAATSGVQKGREALKMLMVGAKATMIASTLLRHGIDYIQTIEQEIINWMTENEYESIAQMQGSMSQRYCPEPSAFERAQYIKALQSYKPQFSLV